MAPIHRENVLADIMDVKSGHIGRSSSLWLLRKRRLADFVVANLRFNGAAGLISAAVSLHHFLQVPRMGCYFADDTLEEGHWPR